MKQSAHVLIQGLFLCRCQGLRVEFNSCRREFLCQLVVPSSAIIIGQPQYALIVRRQFNTVYVEAANLTPAKLAHEIAQFQNYVLTCAGKCLSVTTSRASEIIRCQEHDREAHNV